MSSDITDLSPLTDSVMRHHSPVSVNKLCLEMLNFVSVNKQCHEMLQFCFRQQAVSWDVTLLSPSTSSVMRCYNLVSVNKQCHEMLQSCLRQQAVPWPITVLSPSTSSVMRCYSLVSVNKQCHDILQSCLRQQVAQGDITVLTVSVNTVVRHHRHHSLVCVNIFYRATSTVRHSKKSCLRQEVVRCNCTVFASVNTQCRAVR